MRSRYWGPFRQEWYSLCSGHFEYDPDCDCCNAGQWINVWWIHIDGFLYKYFGSLWFWLHNNSFARHYGSSWKFLKKYFPNIR
jgi:hypothetical protein